MSFLILSIFLSISLNATDINILEAGAAEGGKILNTVIIQNSINSISESGGGTLIIPPGKYLTGSLVLRSGVSIKVCKGAILIGSTNLSDYLNIQPKYVALRTFQATRQLIYAEDQTNISITGNGIIDGQGGAFRRTGDGDEPGITRPHLIQFINCKNVRIENVTMQNSGGWMQHYLACENLIINGISVYNHCNFNNDGLDIDGCRNVVVSDCIVDSDDDAICLKSTSPAPCKDVIISNCIVKSHCNALKLGTESTGGFYNILINNCSVSPSVDPDPIYGTVNGQSAISVEMVDGGILEQVIVTNITVSETNCPIFIRLGNRARKHSPGAPEPGMGVLRNVFISNITATTSSLITSNITGIPGGYSENISLDNILITSIADVKKELFQNEIPENDKGYPTPAMFGNILPASGFFIRHVKNIKLNNIQLVIKGNDSRPAFIFQDVKDALVKYPSVYSAGGDNELIVKDTGCENVRVIE